MNTNTSLPEGFLRLPQVLAIFPISRSAFWAGIKSGKYPKPIKLSQRCSGWRVEDIRNLISNYSHVGAPDKIEALGRDLNHSTASAVIPLPENTTTPPAQSDDKIIRHLASLDSMEYDRLRKEQAKSLNVRLGTLDDKVKIARSDESKACRLPFSEVDFYHEPINSQLLVCPPCQRQLNFNYIIDFIAMILELILC